MRSPAYPTHAAGLKPSAHTTKPGTQRVPGGLPQAAQAAFVTQAERFSAAESGGVENRFFIIPDLTNMPRFPMLCANMRRPSST